MNSPKRSAGEERKRSGDCDGLPGVRVRHQTTTCHALVRILPFVGRAVAVDDSNEQTAIACPSSFVAHCVSWRSPLEGRYQRARCKKTRAPKERPIGPSMLLGSPSGISEQRKWLWIKLPSSLLQGAHRGDTVFAARYLRC